MKGLLLSEFLDFVESRSGYEMVDEIIERSHLASGGAYTAAANYSYAEMSTLFSAFSEISGRTYASVLQDFGTYLFKRFSEIYPTFFEGCHDPLEFLGTLKDRVHARILKFYPDAELPSIEIKHLSDDALLLSYRSCKPLGYLCLGLIQGCGAYFNADLSIEGQSVKDGLDITIRQANRAVYSQQKHVEALP